MPGPCTVCLHLGWLIWERSNMFNEMKNDYNVEVSLHRKFNKSCVNRSLKNQFHCSKFLKSKRHNERGHLCSWLKCFEISRTSEKYTFQVARFFDHKRFFVHFENYQKPFFDLWAQIWYWYLLIKQPIKFFVQTSVSSDLANSGKELSLIRDGINNLLSFKSL